MRTFSSIPLAKKAADLLRRRAADALDQLDEVAPDAAHVLADVGVLAAGEALEHQLQPLAILDQLR